MNIDRSRSSALRLPAFETTVTQPSSPRRGPARGVDAFEPAALSAPSGAGGLEQRYARWKPYVDEAARKYKLDPALIYGVMSRESNGENVVGDGGHGRGLMQIDDRSWGPWLSQNNNGMDPRTNILKGAEILRGNIDYFGGNVRAGVAAYNAGPGNVENALARGADPDSVTTGGDYSRDVLNRAAQFRAQLSGGTNDAGNPEVPQVDLEQGMENGEVLKLQKCLVKLGYLSQDKLNTHPGYFGENTLAAVKAFQAAHGIEQLGRYGPQTRAALNAEMNASISATAPAAGLTEGDTGPGVRQLQACLVKLGYMNQGQVNTGPGVFGSQTRDALTRFQGDWGLPTTGYYGDMSHDAMVKALQGQKPPAPQRGALPTTVQQANAFFVNQRGNTAWNSGKVNNGEGNGHPTAPYGWYDCVPTSGLMAASAAGVLPHPGRDQAEAAIDRVRDASLGYDSTASQPMELSQLEAGLRKLGAKTQRRGGAQGTLSRRLVDDAVSRGHPMVLSGVPWSTWGRRLAAQGNYLDISTQDPGNHAITVLGKTGDGGYLVADPLNRQGAMVVSAADMDAFMRTCFDSLEVSR